MFFEWPPLVFFLSKSMSYPWFDWWTTHLLNPAWDLTEVLSQDRFVAEKTFVPVTVKIRWSSVLHFQFQINSSSVDYGCFSLLTYCYHYSIFILLLWYPSWSTSWHFFVLGASGALVAAPPTDWLLHGEGGSESRGRLSQNRRQRHKLR